MGDLSVNFSRSEFKCKCGDCNFDTVDAELIKVLQDLHDDLSKNWGAKIKITINSGCRCETHNRIVGGSLKSQHLTGKAADIECFFLSGKTKQWGKIKPRMIYELLSDIYTYKYGIGKYDSFTHIDVRLEKARW